MIQLQSVEIPIHNIDKNKSFTLETFWKQEKNYDVISGSRLNAAVVVIESKQNLQSSTSVPF